MSPTLICKRYFVVVASIVLTGCAAPSYYHWGTFEQGLHERYVKENHTQADVYLLETIGEAEQKKLRVPPGAYADYGFLLFKRGDRDGAIAYFEKERRLFPESSLFMTKLIERIQQQGQTEKPDKDSQKEIEAPEEVEAQP